METRLIETLDEIIVLLRQCDEDETRIEQFLSYRERVRRNPCDRDVLAALRILCGPRGFLGDSPHYPKAQSGLTQFQVNERVWRLVEQMDQVLMEAGSDA
ncbi:MAG TPA: hypothetical protein VIM61_03155 [Chthoniobacterales bacterium]|jgi:hypothetical protein